MQNLIVECRGWMQTCTLKPQGLHISALLQRRKQLRGQFLLVRSRRIINCIAMKRHFI